MRRQLFPLTIISLLVWLSMITLLNADTNATLPMTTPLPQWESLLATSPFAVITGIIVKWFMNHIDSKDKTFLDALAKKDADFARLAEQCHAQLQQYGLEIAGTLKDSLSVINKLISKE